MRKQTKTIVKSLMPYSMVAFLTIAAAGCGSGVGSGTYSLAQSGNSYMSACSTISLTLTDSSSTINAMGSASNSGITCTENLQGTEANNVITVSSLTQVLSTGITCTYTGTLTESGSTFTGTLISNTATSSMNNNSSYYCTSLTITGTKLN